jgi:hypothetical protein
VATDAEIPAAPEENKNATQYGRMYFYMVSASNTTCLYTYQYCAVLEY